MLEGGGQDQLCGRTAALLDINHEDFAALPPHFDLSTPVLSADEWAEILPEFSSYPEQFRQAVPFLLASIVYHHQWLTDNLPSNHPLFTSRVWTTPRFGELKSRVHAGVLKNKTTGLMATGYTGLRFFNPDLSSE